VKHQLNLFEKILKIEEKSAIERDELAYMLNVMAQSSMPYRSIKQDPVHGVYGYSRINGNSELTITTPTIAGGLPFGNIPRLLIAWLTTEAVKTRSRDIALGRSMSEFMKKIDLQVTGGANGSIHRLKMQTIRTFTSSISYTALSENGNGIGHKKLDIVPEMQLWWDPKNEDEVSNWSGELRLGENFYQSAIENPVPIDMGVLKGLKKSPMALDQYIFLTYRFSYLSRPTMITWEDLALQFGSQDSSIRSFRQNFRNQLKNVMIFYHKAKIVDKVGSPGLLLIPSKTHVPKLKLVKN
jgi:hypothetical protein